MTEKPYKGRARISSNGNSLEIVIPTHKNWFNIIFLAAWLGGWYMGETSAINEVFNNTARSFNSKVVIFWLIAWTIGGTICIPIFLWLIGGREILTINEREITIGKQVFGIGYYKNYKISDVKYLTLNPRLDKDQWGQSRDRYLLRTGLIEFDYGLKTIRFASGIDMAEARYLIDVLKNNANFSEHNFK